MHTIILHENNKQALFIQKGLQYENLPTEIIDIPQKKDWGNLLQETDGAFILLPPTPDWKKMEELIHICYTAKSNLVLVFLAQSPSINLEKLMDKKILAYYIRPFSFRNIANQMRYAIFMLKERLNEARFILRDLELDIGRHEVKINKKKVYLRNKEFSLLHFFMVNKGKILSRNTILEHVWDRNTNILTNTVDVHVSQLRKKIETYYAPKYIRTVPCLGYIFE